MTSNLKLRCCFNYCGSEEYLAVIKERHLKRWSVLWLCFCYSCHITFLSGITCRVNGCQTLFHRTVWGFCCTEALQPADLILHRPVCVQTFRKEFTPHQAGLRPHGPHLVRALMEKKVHANYFYKHTVCFIKNQTTTDVKRTISLQNSFRISATSLAALPRGNRGFAISLNTQQQRISRVRANDG